MLGEAAGDEVEMSVLHQDRRDDASGSGKRREDERDLIE